MRLAWLKNPDNVVYADINEFADNFGKETGISGLRKKSWMSLGIILKRWNIPERNQADDSQGLHSGSVFRR